MERQPATSSSPREPARYRWTILGLASGAQGSTAALFQGLPAIGPALAVAYGLSLSEVGLVLGSVILGMTITLLPWGFAADRFGERRVIPVGLTGTAIALAAVASTDGYLALTIGLLIAGLWAASANAATGRAIVQWFGASERGLALGVRQAAIPLGGALGAAVLPLVAVAEGPRASLFVLAAFAAVAAGATAVWLRDPPGRGPASVSWPRMRLALRDKTLWRLVAVTLLLVSVHYTFIGFLVLFLTDARGVQAEQAALALVALQLTGAVSRIATGRWSDRVGSRVKPLRLMSITAAGALVALGALADAPAPYLVPALVVAAVASTSWNGLAFTASAEVAPPGASGTALGVQNTAFALGAAVLLPLFGLLVEATSWGLGFALVAACPLGALAVLRRVDE